jgi:preprotein translocase subunit SecE
MVERRSPKPDVEGSSPSWPVASFWERSVFRPLAGFERSCRGGGFPLRGEGAEMKKIVQFFKDSYSELRKVVWPTREDVIASTKVVLISTLVMACVLGLFDYLIDVGITVVFR